MGGCGCSGRILKNLLDNAVRHGGSGKYLGIRLRLKDYAGRVAIEIEDHGPGITNQEKDKIFCRSYTAGRKGSGSGLGLTIARNLALQMGADIEVHSEPGRKTVFAVNLPYLLEKS